MVKKQELSRRARQALDLIYQRDGVTAADLQEAIPDLPSYSAARSILRNLEKKGHVRHERQGAQYVFFATTPASQAKRKALSHLVDTFFNSSRISAMKALLSEGDRSLDERELDELEAMIAKARRET